MKKRGFTLIELLVVISIFGLISSVALANLQGARDQAKQAVGKQFHATIQRSLGDSIVAGWDFNEGAGNVANESTGSGLHGTLYYGVTYTDAGVFGSALQFNGSGFVAGSGFPRLGDNSPITVAMWINPSNIAKDNTLVLLGGADGGAGCIALEVGINGGKVYHQDETGIVYEISEQRIVKNNIWQNLVFVYDDGMVNTYVDGALADTKPGMTTDCASNDWVIGGFASNNGGTYVADGSKGYVGLIDSVYIYSTSFSSEEVKKKYAEDLSRKSYLANL